MNINPVTFSMEIVLYLVPINYLLLTILEVPFYSKFSRSALDRPEGLQN